jgi:hypothetical protein
VQSDFIDDVGLGDWTLDLDASGKYGKVLQHLIIDAKHLAPNLAFHSARNAIVPSAIFVFYF